MPVLNRVADTPHRDSRPLLLTHLVAGMIGFLLLSMFLPSTLRAQPGWVKECSKYASGSNIPREVPAIMLANYAEVTINDAGTATWHYRYAVKVLSGGGVDRTIFQESINEHTSVSNLKGWFLSGSSTEQLKKSQIVEVASSNYAGYYNEDRVMQARFEGVAVGDIVAYEYDTQESSPFEANLFQFLFQDDLPVASSSLSVTIPQNKELIWSGQCAEGIAYSFANGQHRWSAQDLPAQLQQPFMPPWSFVFRKVTFTVLDAAIASKGLPALWDSAGKQAGRLQDRAAEPDSSIADFAQELTQGLTDSIARVKAITDFVRDKIRYVAIEIGAGRFEPRQASSVLANRYGDCKDKVALTRALLKSIQVPSWPVLVSVDRPVQSGIPNPFQFNHCILAIPRSYVAPTSTKEPASPNSLVFVDPTNEALESGRLSGSLSGVLALIAADRESVLTYLPTCLPEDAISRFSADIELTKTGQCQGSMLFVSHGTAASEVRLTLQQVKPADYVEEIKAWLAGSFGGVKVTDFAWTSDGDSVVQTFRVSGTGPLMTAGDKQLLKLDIFTGDRQESIDSKNRQFPFHFGGPRVIETSVNWSIPSSLHAVDSSMTVADSCEIAGYAVMTEISDDRVRFTNRERYTGGTVPAEDVAAIRQWLMRKRTVLGTRLTLTRTEEEQ